MLRFSSFISSSKYARGGALGRAARRRQYVGILFWTIGALILLDIAAGLAFRPPSDPRLAPSALQSYFNYGRSIEGKLRRMIGARPDQDATIAKVGWLARECDKDTPVPPGKLVFDIYGMSFSNQVADQMTRLDRGLAVQSFAGPGAPPNHSYACFIRRVETKRARAPFQILGVLASSVPRLETISGLTTSFEAPEPFTYPRYALDRDGHLVAYSPSIETQNELRAALSDPAKWRVFVNELAAHDAFYAPHVFKADIFDHSVLARMVRRAWGQRFSRDRTAALRAEDSYSGAPDIAPVLRAMLVDFADKARAAGEHPIVILFEDRGYGGTLDPIAEPVLLAHHIDFVATSAIAPTNDTANFLADGHFVPAVNEKIARAVLDLMHRAR